MSQSPNDTTQASDGQTRPTESERHRVLASELRRTTLEVLAERTTPVELDDLAAAVRDRQSDVVAADREGRKEIAVELHHVHLPMMTAVDLLVYDTETGRIESFR